MPTITTEDTGRAAAGLILKALGEESTTQLVLQIASGTPDIAERDVYRELALMLMFATGQAIQKHLPDVEVHGPAMDYSAELLSSALISSPGALDISGATQSFLSHKDAIAINDEMCLDSPTDSLVPARFTLWATAMQRFISGETFAHGNALRDALGLEESLGPFEEGTVTVLFGDTVSAMEYLLQQFRASLEKDSKPKEKIGFGQGCVLGIIGILLMFGALAMYYG